MKTRNKIILYCAGAITAAAVVIFLIRGCNKVVIDATNNIPFVNNVVNKIEQKIPHLLGGTKPKTDPGDKIEEKNEDTRTNHFMWNPRLDLGVGFSTTMKPERKDLIPKVGVGVSLGSYGKSKIDTKYRLGRLGVQTNLKEVEVTVAPVMVRLGGEKHPLFSNTYLFPYVGYNIQRKSPTFGIGISISF